MAKINPGDKFEFRIWDYGTKKEVPLNITVASGGAAVRLGSVNSGGISIQNAPIHMGSADLAALGSLLLALSRGEYNAAECFKRVESIFEIKDEQQAGATS